MVSLSAVLTVGEIAEYLRTDGETVTRELEQGTLQGFRVGDEWRTTEASLRNYVNASASASSITEEVRMDSPSVVGEGKFVRVDPFEYSWPKRKDQDDSYSIEHYDEAYVTTREIEGRALSFTIGFGNREIGEESRRRVVVWLDRSTPLVEFAGTPDFDSSGLLASVIKLPNNKQLRPGQALPPEYGGFRIAHYRSVVKARGASRNMGIVVSKHDLESMLRHAIIRARWKGLV